MSEFNSPEINDLEESVTHKVKNNRYLSGWSFFEQGSDSTTDKINQ